MTPEEMHDVYFVALLDLYAVRAANIAARALVARDFASRWFDVEN